MNKTSWFCKEAKDKYKEKRTTYLKYKSHMIPESDENYRRIRNETKSLVNHLKNEQWEIFSKRMEKISMDCKNRCRE